MGYISHHAIVVTSYADTYIEQAHKKAKELFADCAPVSSILGSQTNGYCSFFIGPDGSKEGWDTSDIGDSRRSDFIHWLRSSPSAYAYDWIVVQYGNDDGNSLICDHSDRDIDEIAIK